MKCVLVCPRSNVTMTSLVNSSSTTNVGVFTSTHNSTLDAHPDGVIRGLDELAISQMVAAVECTLLISLWLLALFGNILVCIVIQRSRRVQSTTNYFVKSLAVSDILLVLMTSPTVCVRIVVNEWTAGHVLCRLIRFLQISTMACTSFVLVAICIDRFYTIVYPLSFKVTRGTAKRAILVAWLSSILISMVSIYFFDLVIVPSPSISNPSNTHHICPTFVPASVVAGKVYAYIVVIVYFIGPALFATIGYMRIMSYIYRTKLSVQNTRTGTVIPRRKVKIARTLLIITIVTLVCYLPFFLAQLIYCFGSSKTISPHVFNISYCLIAASAAIKPVVYACRNSIFWRGCKEVLCMSTMKCYRVNTYTITKASTIAKKNFVGVMELSRESNVMHDHSTSSFDKGISRNLNEILPTTTF